jgi:hypothetical protein
VSTTSPQSAAASQQAEWQATLAKQLSGVTLPELQQLMGPQGLHGMLSGADRSGRMAQDAQVRTQALGQLNQGYDQAKMGTREAVSYGGLRSGEARRSPGAMNAALGGAATSLERDRQAALRNLEFASAQSSMSDYNKVLQLLGQGSSTSLGLAQGFSGAQNAAIGGLSSGTQMGGIIGGASTGASLGAYGGVYGAAAGAVIGGVAGGLSSP